MVKIFTENKIARESFLVSDKFLGKFSGVFIMERVETLKSVLSIAGSDSSGGAGIQADIKTITAHRLFATTAITAVTAQNTLGVTGIEAMSAEFVKAQIDAVFTDIAPDAVKIGMLAESETILAIKERLAHYKAKNVVLDPVMVATSGSRLINDDALDALKSLFSLASLITPNIPEAEVLTGEKIVSHDDMVLAARKLYGEFNAPVLLKGGHLKDSADDLLIYGGKAHFIKGERIETENTHGTGCTLSSAIACNLALGDDLKAAVTKAKEYVAGALRAGLNMGRGSGPLNHMYAL